ncbi:MAG: hypothetical protein IPG92_15035 [Flavobacteriales bacterium]|nr:hypothetical protein [Flavobacteriales bacterium]
MKRGAVIVTWVCAAVQVLLCSMTITLKAQNVQLTGTNEGGDVIVQGALGDSASPAFRAIWRNVPGGMAEFELQRTSSSAYDIRVMLDRSIEAGVEPTSTRGSTSPSKACWWTCPVQRW